MAAAAGGRRHRAVPRVRSRILRRQRARSPAGRVAAARHRDRHLHADDDVEDRAEDHGGSPDGARAPVRDVHGGGDSIGAAAGAGNGGVHDGAARRTPPALAHNLRYNKVLHEHVVVLVVQTEPVPHVGVDRRCEVHELGRGIYRVILRYGFMEDPNVPEALELARAEG